LREAQKALTRQRLLDAAMQEFAAYGYVGTTIDDIARAAGATRATFYLHFKAKSDLIREHIDSMKTVVDRGLANLEKVAEDGSREAIEAWLVPGFDYWEEVRPTSHVIAEAVALEPSLRGDSDRNRTIGIKAIADGLRRSGRVPEETIQARAALCYGQLDECFKRWKDAGWEVDRAHAIKVMAAMWHTAFHDDE
jgi:AcrR family transcriptional regulator